MVILNLTQHAATTEQIEAGVVDNPKLAAEIRDLLTFERLPTAVEVADRAMMIADVARRYDPAFVGSAETHVMIGGAPYLMAPLEKALRIRGFIPIYAFSIRESVETPDGKGGVKKTATFKHVGWVINYDLAI